MKTLLRAALASVALVLAGCPGDPRPYNNHDLALLTSYAAKEMCSCVFVMHKDEAFCLRWTRANPNLRTVRVDHARREVETQAVLSWGARARWISQREGCRLD
ncbi:MAG: hypothetical protein Q8Q09_27425 [Deltaproteobacteria bacterium]|nr:hypothetical protein [Deltaproteobacteria bacterium]